ncbi:MAG: pyridoxal-phosphate dependent enzyme [Oscillospiraceae bacterium]
MDIKTVMKKLPRERLACLPTPLGRLYATEKSLDSPVKLYIKRDDLTGVGSGGNKVRSLEYILGEAKAAGCDTVVASGGDQSNLCSLAAACCAKAGLKCQLVHNSEKHLHKIGNQLLNQLLETDTIYMGKTDSSQREKYVHIVMQALKDRGDKPYLIRNGATTGAGALGYVNAVFELESQCKEQKLQIKHIFAPGGNGGIATGLIYGNALLGFPYKVHIISVEDDKPTLIEHIENTIKEVCEITKLPFDFKVEEAADIVEEYRGEGWSFNTPESEKEVLSFAKAEGIYIENVYTSKLMVGFKDMVKKGVVDGDSVVFHTGGLGSLFAQYPQL